MKLMTALEFFNHCLIRVCRQLTASEDLLQERASNTVSDGCSQLAAVPTMPGSVVTAATAGRGHREGA